MTTQRIIVVVLTLGLAVLAFTTFRASHEKSKKKKKVWHQ